MNRILLFLFFFTYIHASSSLIIRYLNGTNLSLQSTYSTLGIAPNCNITFSNFTFLSNSDINSEDCSLYKNISQTFVIYTPSTSPDMEGCCTDAVFGSDLALAKTLDKLGALGLLYKARERYAGGRVQGFEHVIRMPVGVVSNDVMLFLRAQSTLIANIEFLEICKEDKDSIAYLNYMYSTVVAVYTIVYGGLMALMAIALIIDCVWLFYKEFRDKPHIILLKVGGLATATSTYLWLTVDPFGFHGRVYWQSCLLYNVQQGLFTVICMLVLVLLLLTPKPNTLLNHPKRLAFSVYGGIATVLSVSVIQGVVCSSNVLQTIAAVLNILAVTAISIGFIFFAKEIISTFVRSRNRSKRASVLPIKIGIFSASYIIVQYVVLVITYTNPVGRIISVLVATIIGPFMFFVMFMILFFPYKFLYKILRLEQIKKLFIPANQKPIQLSNLENANTV